jgi:two-component system chemotaxis response regulator CheY
MIDIDEELAQDYLADCRDNLAVMETELLAIKMSESRINDDRLNRILRAAHAIGGPADFFGLAKIRELAYQTEESAAQIRSSNVAPTAEQIRVLLSASDKLQELIQNPGVSNEADIAQVRDDLVRGRVDHSTFANRAAGFAAALPGPDTRLLRILLVEDDFTCRFLLQTFLGRYGQCHVAVNGREAVEAFGAATDLALPYDLICMDIMMPEMDGREAVRQIRSMEQAQGILSTFGAKIFITTTVQQVREVFLCFKELCDAYLMKPIDLGQLQNHMRFFHLLR